MSSQLAVRVIGKVVKCFARDKIICPVFRQNGAITYDERNLTFKGVDKVSISISTGRELVDIIYGKYQAERFNLIKGQCDLIRKNGKFYLLATIDIAEASLVKVKNFIGVDLGIAQIATTDDGQTFSGEPIDKARRRNARARQTFQRRGTRGSRRRLRKIGNRQARFQRHVNHCISKQIVVKALTNKCGIAIEELKGIRKREKTVRRGQRSKLSNWGFFQLRQFLEYKAKLVGVPIIVVKPHNTSRTCSKCGHCEKGNRQSQAVFLCKHCGYSINSDKNGAANIRSLALEANISGLDLAAVAR